MAQTRSQTTYVPTHAISVGAVPLANAIDDAIAQLSADHDVMSSRSCRWPPACPTARARRPACS